VPPVQRYGFVLLPGFGMLSLAGALDVLSAANELLGGTHYGPVLLSVDGREVEAVCGTRVMPAAALHEAPPLDGVFVVMGDPVPEVAEALLDWIRKQAQAGLLLGGIGCGAGVLAQAGVLRGHRATAHWPHLPLLTDRHVDTVFSSHWYEIDRGRLSCAGGTASMDLLMVWLGQRHGGRLGQELAAYFGVEQARGRDERQRTPVQARASAAPKLAEAVALMEANVGEPLPTEDIARLVGVSRRQLERLFKQHLDALPSRYYLELRLDRARKLLQQTGQSILQIGLACGFASGPHFSNTYRAHFGRTPREERTLRASAWRDAPPAARGAQEEGADHET
jgi:transcriptional regulator GlxA family with amidase domain